MRSLRVLWDHFREFRHGPRRYIITLILVILLVALGIYSYYHGKLQEPLNYAESLDQVVVEVNGTDLTLRQMAYYVAYEEMEVEKQALVYNADNPQKYWNLHVDGVFVRVAARNAALQMAVHDEIFYQMAMAEGEELSEDEVEALENYEEDFWNDLADYNGAEKLGITREDLHETMVRMAYAQRYQTIYAILQNAEYEDYDFTKEAYEILLEDNTYTVKKKVWSRIQFGSVIAGH